MSHDMRPPKTQEDILAAREYLRKAFTHAVSRFDAYMASPEAQETDRLLKSLGKLENAQKERAAARETLAHNAQTVAEGGPEADRILDRAIEFWRQFGRPPRLLMP